MLSQIWILTFPFYVVTRVVEQEVLEAVAVRIDMRLPAEARRSEESESLQGAQSRLTLFHRHRRACHCNSKIIIKAMQQCFGRDDK